MFYKTKANSEVKDIDKGYLKVVTFPGSKINLERHYFGMFLRKKYN